MGVNAYLQGVIGLRRGRAIDSQRVIYGHSFIGFSPRDDESPWSLGIIIETLGVALRPASTRPLILVPRIAWLDAEIGSETRIPATLQLMTMIAHTGICRANFGSP